jgi:hypothetical protein
MAAAAMQPIRSQVVLLVGPQPAWASTCQLVLSTKQLVLWGTGNSSALCTGCGSSLQVAAAIALMQSRGPKQSSAGSLAQQTRMRH